MPHLTDKRCKFIFYPIGPYLSYKAATEYKIKDRTHYNKRNDTTPDQAIITHWFIPIRLSQIQLLVKAYTKSTNHKQDGSKNDPGNKRLSKRLFFSINESRRHTTSKLNRHLLRAMRPYQNK